MADEDLGKGQASRLSKQHEDGGGAAGIWTEDALSHDRSIREVAESVLKFLADQCPNRTFRYRKTIRKSEIHRILNETDRRLGTTLYVDSASIQPDGGVIEVKDIAGNWRVILVGESKHQGNDIPNIKAGKRTKVLEEKGEYVMPAGNAIERVHKNIQEFKNFLINERHFPYVVFLQGSNFAVETVNVQWPNGPVIEISPNSSNLNRIDRVTSATYGQQINTNYCRNMYLDLDERTVMLQTASFYARHDPWTAIDMAEIMLEIAQTSLAILDDEIPACNIPKAERLF